MSYWLFIPKLCTFPKYEVLENLLFVATGDKTTNREIAKKILQRFDLSDFKNTYPRQLYGGQQQRVALARILMTDAKLLLLDEPFSALDNYLKWQVEMEFAKTLQDYSGVALLVSHDRGELPPSELILLNK